MPFGAYAQVHGEPKHGNDAIVSRTVGGKSLGPKGNIQGTYKFMSLLTGRLIKAWSFTPLLMPDEVINMVKKIELSEITKQHYHENNLGNQDLVSPPLDDVSLDVDSTISTKELVDLIQDDSNKQDDISTIDHDTIQDDNDNVPIQIGFDSEPFPESVSSNETSEDENEDKIEETSDNIIKATVDENIQTEEIVNEGPSPRTRYITQSGRHVRINKDIFQNYDFIQVDRHDWGSQCIQDEIKIKFYPNSQTPSIRNTFDLKPMDKIPRFESHSNDVMIQCAFTQYSLKAWLKAFPVEARDAVIAEVRQLHEMQVFSQFTNPH
jgi:hypothetical protein